MLVAALLAGAGRGQPSADTQRLDRALKAATGFLLGRIDPNGKCRAEPMEEDPRFGGKTALSVQALLTAGVDPEKSEPLARAIGWLGRAKLTGTYAIATRAAAWALLRDPNAAALLKRDTAWLLRAMNDQGGYTYTSSGGRASEAWDNSNAQMALLGVAAGVRRGAEVPPAYWQRAERYWTDQQQLDGGWGYRTNPRTLTARTYGSMTAAGLASLYLCFDQLRADQFVRCTPMPQYQPIDKAMAWLGQHFTADENPQKGVEWYYYWLYTAARVGLASGHKYFAAHDWYAEGRRALLARQNPGGSWGYGDCIAETAFALMFLARGQAPILVNKLQYDGQWNARPRDAANLAAWISETFERRVGWQVVNLKSPPADWHDAPILYLSGAGPIQLTAEQIDKIRTYVLQGGTLLSEATCNSGDFTLDMGKLYGRLFPDYPLIRLPETHTLYSAHFLPPTGAWLSGVSNGVRMLAVHAPRELSLAMQLGPKKLRLPLFQLLANIYMYATDRGNLRPRGATYWPVAEPIQPRATIRVARLGHGGNSDPEPLAWQRMGILMGNRHKVRLDVAGPVPIAKLDAKTHPIAHITGTDAFELTGDEAAALRRFFAAGGALIADAAGGSRLFTESLIKHVYPLVPGGKPGELARGHPLYLKGPYELDRVSFRSDYARTLGDSQRNFPRLRVVVQGRRLAIVHSREDLTFGLLGAPAFKLIGYTPASAEKLMTNILFHAAGVEPE